MKRNRVKLESMVGIIFMLILAAWTIVPPSSNAEIPWRRSVDQTFASAQQSGKPILVFVSTEWCHYCKLMKKQTWSDASLESTVRKDFETLYLDGDTDKEVVQAMQLSGYPATLVYDSQGNLLTRKDGFIPARKASAWLESIARR